MKRALTLVFSTLMAVQAVSGETQSVGGASQTQLAVTIYNSDLALVKDRRTVSLFAGEGALAWREVSARMQPETALLRVVEGQAVSLLEQNFDFDLLTPQKMLEKSVGQTVRVIKTRPMTGDESVETATVLSANNGVVLKFPDRIETGLPGRLAFDGVPAGLRDRPTLSLLLRSPQAGPRSLELSYLTGGLSWQADYVAELAADDGRLDLNGWVTLTNQSGAAYHNALLQLVAGNVNRVRPAMKRMDMMRAPVMAEAGQAMQEEGLFEYHLYTLDRATTLLEQQTKQVALLTARQVPVRKEYLLRGAEHYYQGQYGDLGQKLKPEVFVAFDNKSGGLGVPLPKGIVRVYKQDSAGRSQFVGEDSIDHTPKGEEVKLRLGEAFDITADRRQTDYQKLSGINARGSLVETAFQLEIRNAKQEKVVVKVVEPMPGDWQIVAENLAHHKENAHTASWLVPVAAEGKTTLVWRVKARF